MQTRTRTSTHLISRTMEGAQTKRAPLDRRHVTPAPILHTPERQPRRVLLAACCRLPRSPRACTGTCGTLLHGLRVPALPLCAAAATSRLSTCSAEAEQLGRGGRRPHRDLHRPFQSAPPCPRLLPLCGHPASVRSRHRCHRRFSAQAASMRGLKDCASRARQDGPGAQRHCPHAPAAAATSPVGQAARRFAKLPWVVSWRRPAPGAQTASALAPGVVRSRAGISTERGLAWRLLLQHSTSAMNTASTPSRKPIAPKTRPAIARSRVS